MLQSHNHVLRGHDVLYTPTKYFKRTHTQSVCLMDVKSFTLCPGPRHGYIFSLRLCTLCHMITSYTGILLLVLSFPFDFNVSLQVISFERAPYSFSHSPGCSYLSVFRSYHSPSNSSKSFCAATTSVDSHTTPIFTASICTTSASIILQFRLD